jgi:small GTP-binding protein
VSARDDDNGKPNIAVVGRFQIGKSTLINCLLDDRVARTGTGIATTKVSTIYTYGQIPSIEVARTWKDGLVVWEDTDFHLRDFLNPGKGWEGISATRISLWKPLLQQINLIDTPGIDANADDTAQAVASLDRADFVMVLLENRGICDAERRLFADIRKRNLPFAVIVNCRDANGKRWLPEFNGEIVRAVSAELSNLGHLPTVISGKSGVWACNLLLFWHASEHLFEDPDAGDVCEDIERYVSHNLKKKATRALTYSQSNFEPIRLFFEHNHWFLTDADDKGKGEFAIASPETIEFVQKFWDDQVFFTPFLENVLRSCWFSATPLDKPYRELLSLADKACDESEGEKYQRWIIDLARAVERWPLLNKFAWANASSRVLTDWFEAGIMRLSEPYLVASAPDVRNSHRQRFQAYVAEVNANSLHHDIAAALFPLRDDYEKLAAAWKELRKHAPGTRNYFKNTFGSLFADEQETPAVFRGNVSALFDAMTGIMEQGNRLLQPFIDVIVGKYWNGAVELLLDICGEMANHGQNLSEFAYDTPQSVKSIPWTTDTVFHAQASMLLADAMDAADIPDDQKKHLYCLCRRIGVKAAGIMKLR